MWREPLGDGDDFAKKTWGKTNDNYFQRLLADSNKDKAIFSITRKCTRNGESIRHSVRYID
jgi:hypothetical protein